jgi:hypothetical protein
MKDSIVFTKEDLGELLSTMVLADHIGDAWYGVEKISKMFGIPQEDYPGDCEGIEKLGILPAYLGD